MEENKRGVCRYCGCQWGNACSSPDLGPCWWVDDDETLCSHCSVEESIANGIQVYLSDNENLQKALIDRIRSVAEMNKNLMPYIDRRYKCDTCGSDSGMCHPESSYCFLCDTDNWEWKGID